VQYGGAPPCERDHRLALRWPRCDRWPLDRKMVARIVDVVQFIPVDEPSGSGVTNLGVVFPAVPKSADDLDDLLGFGIQAGVIQLVAAAAKELRLCISVRGLHLPACPPQTDVVQGGNILGYVRWFGMRYRQRRDEPDAVGARGNPGGNQTGIKLTLIL